MADKALQKQPSTVFINIKKGRICQVSGGDVHRFTQPASKAPQEQLQSSKQVLTSKQQNQAQRQQSQLPHHRRSSAGNKIVALKGSSVNMDAPPPKSRKIMLDEYLMTVDPCPMDFQQFRLRNAAAKYVRDVVAPPSPDYLTTMPDEVLLRIFKHLPKAGLASLARTNHRFLGLIEDDSLWKRLCVMGKHLNPDSLFIIMFRKPIYLRMARTVIPDPVEIPSDLSSLAAASQLTHLDLSSADVSPTTLSLIMAISPKLVKLSLELLNAGKIVMESMMSFTATIEVLNLTMCYDVDAKAMTQFLSKCQRLTELNMGCLRCEWSHEDLTAVINALPSTIQLLNISGFRSLLDDTHVAVLVRRCPRLLELDISDSQEVRTKSVDYIMKLPHIQHLSLSRCYNIEPQIYNNLSGHKSLKYLDLFSLFKETALRQMSNSLQGMEINKYLFSAIARPTVGNKRSSIWLKRVRD